MKKGKAIALVAVGLVAGLVLGAVGISYAATDTQNPASCLGLGVKMGQTIRDAGGRLVDIVAELTGLTVDEVRAARAEGTSIADIAEANGASSDEVVDAALKLRKEVLDAKVAEGTITQEQADEAYERMSERIEERVTSTETGRGGFGPGRGVGGGRGGGQGGGCGACSSQ